MYCDTGNDVAVEELSANKVDVSDLLTPKEEESGALLVGVTRNIKHLPFKHTSEVKVSTRLRSR